MTKIAILGAGSWGLTLSWLLAQQAEAFPEQEKSVWLWDRNPEKISHFAANRAIQFPVSVHLSESVHLTASLADAVRDAEIILMVVTTAGTRPTAQALAACGQLASEAIVVNASKGVELPSLQPLHQVIAEELPQHRVAVLSGPTLAGEILSGLPTACVVACDQLAVAEYLQQSLSCENRFRLYSNQDVIGVEMGGAMKNVFAIVSGYMQAMRLGENARAALITRGLAEMTRFCLALGAEAETLYGLSGLGDLFATCNSPLSRNHQVGFRLAKGESLEAILADLKVVAEGVHTTRAVSQLAERIGVDVPIVKQVEYALSGAPISPEMLIRGLMSRRLKSEHAQQAV
ncbi:MAG: NAD(P)H-dependent glycerol-3-phosphate dehydrogenase [Candidatus Melainabacteria bacterium]|nr:NAD(P)H-dependent glycerol-3-phosphate dehydrogenase [Candidatus Melainabacteria bacterium]